MMNINLFINHARYSFDQSVSIALYLAEHCGLWTSGLKLTTKRWKINTVPMEKTDMRLAV